MTDANTDADDIAESQDEPVAGAAVSPHKHKKSGGERLFNRVVYTGIGFGVNEVSSLVITDQIVHGKNLLKGAPVGLEKVGSWFSKEGYERASKAIADTFKLTQKVAKDGSVATPEARGGNALLMVLLLSGGTLLLLPMKWIENHKIYWVKKANHLLDKIHGNKLAPEEVAARDTKVEQDIACSPKQSWSSMLVGRVIAMCSSVATGTFIMGPKNNAKLMNWAEKTFTGSLQTEGKMHPSHRYVRLISIETYSCAISSIVLEVMSKLFAKHKYTPHDADICQATAAALPATSDDKPESDDCGCTGKYTKTIQSQRAQASLAAAHI